MSTPAPRPVSLWVIDCHRRWAAEWAMPHGQSLEEWCSSRSITSRLEDQCFRPPGRGGVEQPVFHTPRRQDIVFLHINNTHAGTFYQERCPRRNTLLFSGGEPTVRHNWVPQESFVNSLVLADRFPHFLERWETDQYPSAFPPFATLLERRPLPELAARLSVLAEVLLLGQYLQPSGREDISAALRPWPKLQAELLAAFACAGRGVGVSSLPAGALRSLWDAGHRGWLASNPELARLEGPAYEPLRRDGPPTPAECGELLHQLQGTGLVSRRSVLHEHPWPKQRESVCHVHSGMLSDAINAATMPLYGRDAQDALERVDHLVGAFCDQCTRLVSRFESDMTTARYFSEPTFDACPPDAQEWAMAAADALWRCGRDISAWLGRTRTSVESLRTLTPLAGAALTHDAAAARLRNARDCLLGIVRTLRAYPQEQRRWPA